MEIEGLYSLAEGIVQCAIDDAALTQRDPARAVYTKREVERVKNDGSWFLDEVKVRLPLGALESVYSTVFERRAFAPVMMPLFEMDDEKVCIKCGEKKQEVAFAWMPNHGRADGVCRDCRSKQIEFVNGSAENAQHMEVA